MNFAKRAALSAALAGALLTGVTALTTGTAAAADVPIEGVQCNHDNRRTPPAIRLGSEGAAVREAQCLLSFWGHSIGDEETAGVFGTGTEEAVERFQTVRGLPADGIVGPETWGQLRHS
ncbi:peptidoglycan-binding protein [Streptomyces sp. ISL-11]|uniref:peptidoglycan-binding domain-containing protein n=1 Tax=Streptomyces sp. ISL-11 TaxID=2819174 RepID=UPI001BEB3076|nr:peptidoglycan-binding domain-containing protein [Streptomyces sp. ISL-11]MBT2387344.1 peptidoglycan-binding protein [Streptomyces sp. ISL-11]